MGALQALQMTDYIRAFRKSPRHNRIIISKSLPKDVLRVLYYNARRLLRKFDELILSVNLHAPDVTEGSEFHSN